MSSSNKSGCAVIVLLVLFIVSAVINLVLVVVVAAKDEGLSIVANRPVFNQRVIEGSRDASERIAVIPLSGLISFSVSGRAGQSMVEDLRFAFDQALEDDGVKAIVLEVDSGGGEVTASDEVYHIVRAARDQKPVGVSMTSVAASGAYYAACGGTHIMAYESTFTGSIGVIIQTLNYRELFGKIGLQSVVFKSGKFKDLLNGARELTEEEREYVQNLVMQSYAQFLGVVATERNLDPEALQAGAADGRILSGRDALTEKLIDSVGRTEQAFEKARELGGAPDAAVVRYLPPSGFARLFEVLGESRTDRVEIDLAGAGSRYELEPGRLYYLPSQLMP